MISAERITTEANRKGRRIEGESVMKMMWLINNQNSLVIKNTWTVFTSDCRYKFTIQILVFRGS